MAIKVRCPGCRQKIRYNQAPQNRHGRCPRCATVVLTMEDDSTADPEDDPAASHDAVVPPRRRTRPDDDTAVFTPLFTPPAPAIPSPPSALALPRPLPPRAGSTWGDLATAIGLAALVGMALVGAAAVGLVITIVLTQFA